MVTIQQRISFLSATAFLVITLLASSSPSAYADLLFIGEPKDAVVAEEDEEASSMSTTLDTVFAGDEFADEATSMKKSNPVAVLSGSVNKKLKGVVTSVNVALRESLNTTSVSRDQWPVVLAVLLFLMLLMRLKRRSRKSKFS